MGAIVKTSKGQIRGTESEFAYIYKGIPYAKPPVGNLRFHAPVPADSWDGVYDAHKFRNMCLQSASIPGTMYHKEFYSRKEYIPPMSEDCLYLNIWVPKNAEKPYPVAIWFHGGGFRSGYSSEIEFDGEAYAKRGIILITVNYRLGIFGYFCHSELKIRDGHSGNYGLLDQIASIDWVRENIAEFGGDPENITVFGQSAGGMSIRYLVSSPLTKGKIHRAIIQSGKGYQGNMMPDFSYDMVEKLWAEFLKKKRISFDKLYTLPSKKLMRLSNQFSFYSMIHAKEFLIMTPVVDGCILPKFPDDAVNNNETLTIPYLTGANKDDLFSGKGEEKNLNRNELLKSLCGWSERHTARGVDCFVYYFSHNLPGDKSGAFHSAELWYVFGTLDRCWRPMKQEDYELSERMVDAWTSFMRTGNPGWEPYRGEGGYIEQFI